MVGAVSLLVAGLPMKVFGHSVGLRPWATVAAYGVALAFSLDSFRVGATGTVPAEMLIAPIAIVVAVFGLGIGPGIASKKSVSRVAVLLWIVLALFLVASVPRWISTDVAATKQVLSSVVVVVIYAGAATWAGLLFDDGVILHAMRTIVLLNAAVTVVQFGLSLVLHHAVMMPWQSAFLLSSNRPCGWFQEPAHYGTYVALWASMDEKRLPLVNLVTVALALLAGGSIISLLALILIVVRWAKMSWGRKGPIAAVLVVLLTVGVMALVLRFPAVQLRLSQLGNGSAFARVAKTPLVLSQLWRVDGVGMMLFGYGPARAGFLINGGSFSGQILASGDYLNGWGQGITWWGILGVFLCCLMWIAASRRSSSRWVVMSVALVLAILEFGADISPTLIAFWIPALVMSSGSGTSLYGVKYAQRSGWLIGTTGGAEEAKL